MLLLCITRNHLIFQIQNQHNLSDTFLDLSLFVFFIFEDTTLEKAIKKHNSELSEDRERKKLISFKHTMNTYKLFLGPSDNSENGVASWIHVVREGSTFQGQSQ